MSKQGHGARGRGGDRHWHPLKPSRSLTARLYGTLMIGAAMTLIAVLYGGGRVFSAPHRTAGGVGLFLALLVAGLVPLGVAVYTWLLTRKLDDAKVFIDRRDLSIGREFNVRVEQRARRGLHINEMRVALVCVETARHTSAGRKEETRTVPVLEKWETLTKDKEIDHARRLAATRTFRIPPGQRASSPVDRKEPPIIRWKLRVYTAPAHSPVYDVDFPIHVHATSADGFWDEINSESVPSVKRR